jgi:hypothetical protein
MIKKQIKTTTKYKYETKKKKKPLVCMFSASLGGFGGEVWV